MSTVVSMDSDAHSAVQGLLPWFARGQLDEADTREVQEHLLQCAACRAELELEDPVRAMLSLSVDTPDNASLEAGLAKMRDRLQERTTSKPSRSPRWLNWAVGLQGCAIAVLLTLVVQMRVEGPALYKGLASPNQPVHATALIMFRADASEQNIRAALQAHGASLVGGPTESGAYQVQLAKDPKALRALRAERVVTLLESLEPGAAK
ncbi:MAG TPA: zf-HC2 domain-containing protein [Burkholderiaceae bacterium]